MDRRREPQKTVPWERGYEVVGLVSTRNQTTPTLIIDNGKVVRSVCKRKSGQTSGLQLAGMNTCKPLKTQTTNKLKVITTMES